MEPPRPTQPSTHAGRVVRRYRVEVVGGPAVGETWREHRERCVIGSHEGNDIVLDDPTVSRYHCELAIIDDQIRIRDLGSRNGTQVDNILIADGKVSSGAVLVLGRSLLRLVVEHDLTEIEQSTSDRFGSLVGTSTVMRELFSRLERVAPTDATVLIEGETGTGKEGIAAALHDASPRHDRPFVVVDCGAMPANLLENELFGHVAGAFTGAVASQPGAFEEADGGTLFLDEIGELPLDLQPKLLRALESREVRRLGSRKPVSCDLRVIAATNRDLRAEVNRGAFRADLYYRLAVVRVPVPPLRSHLDDLPLLVREILQRLGASQSQIGERTDERFLDELRRSSWPGNVRELRNVLEQSLVLGVELAEPPDLRARPPVAPRPVDPSLPYDVARRQALDDFERTYLQGVLARVLGSPTRAAREAKVNRSYLYRMLRRHNLLPRGEP